MSARPSTRRNGGTRLLADLAYEACKLPCGPFGSIFFGGGTPSLMPPETVAALVDAAGRHWGFAARH
jgi:oxygen-independent coproporphyrinogen-3 oxidase